MGTASRMNAVQLFTVTVKGISSLILNVSKLVNVLSADIESERNSTIHLKTFQKEN